MSELLGVRVFVSEVGHQVLDSGDVVERGQAASIGIEIVDTCLTVSKLAGER